MAAVLLKHSAMRRASFLVLLVAGWALLAMAATSGAAAAEVQVDSANNANSAANELSAEQLEQLRAGSEKFEFQAEYALFIIHIIFLFLFYSFPLCDPCSFYSMKE